MILNVFGWPMPKKMRTVVSSVPFLEKICSYWERGGWHDFELSKAGVLEKMSEAAESLAYWDEVYPDNVDKYIAKKKNDWYAQEYARIVELYTKNPFPFADVFDYEKLSQTNKWMYDSRKHAIDYFLGIQGSFSTKQRKLSIDELIKHKSSK